MKLLYVVNYSRTVNLFLLQHIKLLQEMSYEVDILCEVNEEIDTSQLLREPKIFDKRFSKSPISMDNLSVYKQLKDFFTQNNYDVVHVHTPIPSLLSRVALRKNKNVKIIYTAHGFHFFNGSSLKNWLIYFPVEKIASYWTDALITINKEDYKNALKFKNKRLKDVFLMNGVGLDVGRFTRSSDSNKYVGNDIPGLVINEDDYIMFYAAELNENKNQGFLIRMMKEIKETHPNIKLVLAGTGASEQEYKQLVHNLNLEDSVKILGYRKDIDKLLDVSDLVVASSLREGLPVNILEAMAKGIPIVATNTRGHNELIEDGVNGFLVEIGDSKTFIERIKSLYTDNELSDSFIKSSKELVIKYDVGYVKNSLEKVYKELFAKWSL